MGNGDWDLIKAFLAFLISLEQIALEANREVIEMPRSRLVTVFREGISFELKAAATLDFVTSMPRPSWFQVPVGYALRDWYPWRFRRRLAISRRPFLQLDDTVDPTILCAPGLIRDAFRSMVTWYRKEKYKRLSRRECNGGLVRLTTYSGGSSMKPSPNACGIGWEAKAEVKVTEILGRSFDRDYGDVDVLAWRADTSRILAIECKDLQVQTTMSEVAEQLSDFRGETRANGKRDHLKRHLIA